jgi:hypothetical protein
MLEVNGEAVEAVCNRRSCRAAAGILGAEHEVIDKEL